MFPYGKKFGKLLIFHYIYTVLNGQEYEKKLGVMLHSDFSVSLLCDILQQEKGARFSADHAD